MACDVLSRPPDLILRSFLGAIRLPLRIVASRLLTRLLFLFGNPAHKIQAALHTDPTPAIR